MRSPRRVPTRVFADAAELPSRLLFVGLLIESAEAIRMREAFEDSGLFARRVIALVASRPAGYRVQIGPGGGAQSVSTMMGLQAVAALVVLAVGLDAAAGAAAGLTCLVTSGYLRWRRAIGGNGADQLTFMVLATFAMVVLAGGGSSARRAGDTFVAAQVCLAYFAAGCAKLISPVWRSGEAINGVLATEGFGIPRLGRRLSNAPALSHMLCWGVIVWECAFPLALVAPRPITLGFLSSGVLFHLTCAVVMGLNRFVWAFCGCYSAVWLTGDLLR